MKKTYLHGLGFKSVEEFASALREYERDCKFQTLKGALIHLGIGVREWEDLRGDRLAGDKIAVKLFEMIGNYKLRLECKMEQWLLYQSKHPDLENVKFYNYENLKFLLKASDPATYDPARVNVSAVLENTKSSRKASLPNNMSGVNLWENLKK